MGTDKRTGTTKSDGALHRTHYTIYESDVYTAEVEADYESPDLTITVKLATTTVSESDADMLANLAPLST